MPVLDRKELEESPLSDLHAIASELGIEGYRRLRRDDLIDALAGASGGGSGAKAQEEPAADDEEKPTRRRRTRRSRPKADESPKEEPEESPKEEAAEEPEQEQEVRQGVLDILPNGSGFMRPDAFAHSRDDVYVSPAQIRRLELRPGDEIEGPVRSPRRNERHPSLVRVDKVNGGDAEQPGDRARFEDLTPVFATQALTTPDGLDATPFGRGSRVAVGGPPGSGITTLLRRIVLALKAAHEELDVTVVLAGVRPEEVTEWKRDSAVTVAGGGFDRPVEEQGQAAESAIERGKRAAEAGRHAVVVVDSLDALPPAAARRVFGAARATEEAGTLTVIASTGTAGEPLRQATTRIVLDVPEGGPGPHPPKLSAASGTLRADLLK
jgi:transcription termination factor Rho